MSINVKKKQYISLKKNYKNLLDAMIPGDKYLPSFTKAVKVGKIINKFINNNSLKYLKNCNVNLDKKEDWDKITDVLKDEVLETYFTSKLVIKALNNRKKIYLKYKKKENIFKLILKVKKKKTKFIK